MAAHHRYLRASPKWRAPGRVVVALLVLEACVCSTPGEQKKAPHPIPVILISVDTERADHLSLYGYDRETSPELDALASDAVVFETAIAAHTNTAPAHASIMTGLYPPSHGVLRNAYPLPEKVPVLAQILQTHGYQTAGFVSGFTLNADSTRLNRGFDHYDDPAPQSRDQQAQRTVERALRWLRSQRGEKPLFVFLHLFDPHFPYRAPDRHALRFLPPDKKAYEFPVGGDLDRMRRGEARPGELAEYVSRYDGEIHYADHSLGRVLDLLREKKIYEQSLIIYLSDHGETLTERPFVFDHGARAYEEQIRVPLAIRFPRGHNGRQRLRQPVHQVDILPTVLDILGIAAPPHHGHSLLPMVRGEAPLPSRPLFSMARPEPRRVPGLPAPMAKKGLIAAIRYGGLKLIAYPTTRGEAFELFNLKKDPGETKSLAGEQPKVVARLRAELERWREATGANQPVSPPDLSPDVRDALRELGYLE